MLFHLTPGQLTFEDLSVLMQESTTLQLDERYHDAIYASEKVVANVLTRTKPCYGINTGFGALANTSIGPDDLMDLQHNLILSSAAGTGELLRDDVVRLALALKINGLAQGFSGLRLQTLQALIQLYNAKIYPCIPSKGSVGASGDLAPLAHLSAILLGYGDAHHQGMRLSAKDALSLAGLLPLTLAPKEGLALINGTQISTALALYATLAFHKVFNAALLAGALTVDAVLASDEPFDERIQTLRGQTGQIHVAKILRRLLKNSPLRESHRYCDKIQDAYSLRCQPQVMGACLDSFTFAKNIFIREANAVTDNPLIFAADHAILSGGNFHAEPIAMAADVLALSISEVGGLSERRIALMVDTHFSSLPPFLIQNAGQNSGFMIPQVTAAALASENKVRAAPSSVDSIPTSANQEDHVSMATYAAKRLLDMVDNTQGIIAIELLAACQGIDFRRPLKTSPVLEKVYATIREKVPFYAKDHYFSPDIQAVKNLIADSVLSDDLL